MEVGNGTKSELNSAYEAVRVAEMNLNELLCEEAKIAETKKALQSALGSARERFLRITEKIMDGKG